MNKEVKVVLGLVTSQFTAGLSSARSALGSFTNGIKSGIGEGLALFAHLGQSIDFVTGLFRGLIDAAKSLFDTFIGGVAAEERLTNQLGRLMGSSQDAKKFVDGLSEANLKLGFSTDDSLPFINQFAAGLKAMDGAVDPEKLSRMNDMMHRITAARPDITTGEAAGVVIKALRGDTERLKMVLGVGLEDIQGLSEKSKQTLENMKGAVDTQLGQVTRLGGGVKATTQDSLDVLDEYLNALGMTQKTVEDTSHDWDRNVARMMEIWDTFTDTVGAPLLKVLNDELSKLSDWLAAHKPEIEAFAKQLGEMGAEKLKEALAYIEKVPWDQVMKNAEGFAKFLSAVPWDQIANAMTALNKMISGKSGEEALAKLTPEERQRREVAGKSAIAGATGVGALLNVAGGADWKQQASQWAQSNLPNLTSMPGFADSPVGKAIDYEKNVHVTVSFDDNGKLQAAIQKQALSSIGSVVTGATKSNRKAR